MQGPDLRSTAAPHRTARLAWLAAGLCLALAAVGFARHRGSERPAALHGEAKASTQVTAEELNDVKRAVERLDRRTQGLAAAVTAAERPAPDDQVEMAPPAKVEDTRSPTDRRREILSELDVVLATDQGALGDRRATAEALRAELAGATANQAGVVEVECATSFCKAVLEQATSTSPGLDISALIDSTPGLQREAMFDYEQTGVLRRIFIYVAREGQRLPIVREAAALKPASVAARTAGQ